MPLAPDGNDSAGEMSAISEGDGVAASSKHRRPNRKQPKPKPRQYSRQQRQRHQHQREQFFETLAGTNPASLASTHTGRRKIITR